MQLPFFEASKFRFVYFEIIRAKGECFRVKIAGMQKGIQTFVSTIKFNYLPKITPVTFHENTDNNELTVLVIAQIIFVYIPKKILA